ncbi:MAG: hypothetical protein AVO39_10595 [delta proteobacterium MLS_D]|jgi:phytoene dehydrogenase-like protein|nr:MAG: hypothetical protein AVO39_10595 [delta proteobacterium MLS_D]
MSDYDVIVVGAGNGGLGAAVTLARKGLKTLLLERHNVPGGSATTFCRGRFEFEVALHQLSGIGTPDNRGPLWNSLKKLDVLDDLEFIEMKDLNRIVIPGVLDITLRTDVSSVVEELGGRFPREKDAVSRFFELVYRYAFELYSYFTNRDAGADAVPLVKRYAFKTAQQVLDEFFEDPVLKAVFGAYWGFLGLTPNRLPFSYLAILFFSFIEMKPCHIMGGSQALSNALVNKFIAHGGAVRFNCAVKRILVKNGSVAGVETGEGDEITARYVVSNASKVSTYVELLDREHVPDEFLKEMSIKTPSPSGFCVYLGLDCEPEEVGITAATNTIMNSADLSDGQYNRMHALEFDADTDMVGFSCYDVADSRFSPEGACQVSLLTLKYAEPWLRLPPTRYYSEKYRCADAMVSLMEKVCPDVRNHIEEVEVATPLTFMRYLATPYGSVYGFDQYAKDSLFMEHPRETPVEGLVLAGGWITDCGFETTIKSGISAAGTIMRSLGAER